MRRKNVAGQFVGKVEAGSPAEEAGLRKGDHIVEVNDVNVQEGSHSDVVGRIRSQPNMVRLLVINKEEEDFYTSRDVTIHGRMPNIVTGEAKERGVNRIDFHDDDINNNADEKGEDKSQQVEFTVGYYTFLPNTGTLFMSRA